MRIAVIGTGNVGRALGLGLARAGHDVVFGSRRPSETSIGDVPVATSSEAVAGAEVVVLAVPASAAEATLQELPDLAGAVVVDTTNAVDWSRGPAVAVHPSQAERLASLAPGARVVKAFNHIGAEHLDRPSFRSGPPDLFVAGDDEEARRVVMGLAADLGFNPVDAGPLVNARALEHLAVLWMYLATRGGHGRGIAFRLVEAV